MLRSSVLAPIIAVLIAIVPARYSIGQPNVWNGTRRLNAAKSRLGGPTFIITILPGGRFKIATRNISYTLICDGRYRPVTSQRSLACTKETLTSMDVAERDSGRAVNTVHREVSPDGNSLIQTITTIEEHGPGKATQKIFTRSSKPTGLMGEWTDPKELDRQPQLLVTEVNKTVFHLGFPMENQYADIRLDGTEASIHGMYGGVHNTISLKIETAQRLHTVQKVSGVIVAEGTLILSPDGESITEEIWKPGAPRVKSRLVYEKQ